MATATAKKAMKLVCPFCGGNEAINMDLNDPAKTLTCESCDEEGSPREFAKKAAENAGRWAAVSDWIESYPAE